MDLFYIKSFLRFKSMLILQSKPSTSLDRPHILRQRLLSWMAVLGFSILSEGCVHRDVADTQNQIQLRSRPLDPEIETFLESYRGPILERGKAFQRNRLVKQPSPVFDLSIKNPPLDPQLQANLADYKALVDALAIIPDQNKLKFGQALVALFWQDPSSYILIQEAPLELTQNLRAIYRIVPQLLDEFEHVLRNPPALAQKSEDYSAYSPYGHYLAILQFMVASLPFEIYSPDECEGLFRDETRINDKDKPGFIRLYQLYYRYGVDKRFEQEIEGVDPGE